MPQLSNFFDPKSVAVFGASAREGSMGGIVLRNLVEGDFKGQLIAVNLKGYGSVFGIPCVTGLDKTSAKVDLAILCLPAEQIKKAIKHCAKSGVKGIMLLTGGISRRKSLGQKVNAEIHRLASQLGVRILGPNSMGVLVPAIGLNASFSHVNALKGNTAFIGQSAALGSALIDWATGKGIGFSHFATIGAGADLDISDLVDYLAADRRVKSILLHVETIKDPRRLMTALRAASRTKNVLAIRSGLNDSTPPGLKSRERVDYRFFRRAGVLEVSSFDQLFAGLEVLSRMKPLYFESLAIISNGLGPAMLAKNKLKQLNGHLADLSKIHEDDPDNLWYSEELGSNPIILPPNADAAEIGTLIKKLDKLPNLGAILFVHTPNRRSIADELAEELATSIKPCHHMVLTNFVGNTSVQKAREHFDNLGLLNFESPSDAVDAFMTMVHHERNQESLRETPPNKGITYSPDKTTISGIIAKAKTQGRDYLNWMEAREILKSYGMELVPSSFNKNLQQLIKDQHSVDQPVSLRLVHEAYCYPFAYDLNPRLRWRAVKIQLKGKMAIEQAAMELEQEKNKRFPTSKVLGFGIQPMLRKMDYLQFSMGITRDSLVGPLIVFGEGGTAAEILEDRRFALPPLNANHARKLIYRSYAYQVLSERSTNLEVDTEVLANAILVMSQITIDWPEINGLEANLLLIPNKKLIVLGVAVSIGNRVLTAISPYPAELEKRIKLTNGQSLLLRPIKAEDEQALKNFFNDMDSKALRYRFFGSRLSFEHRELAAMCQIDYEREMAFVAVDNDERIFGEIRTWQDVNKKEIEFAVMVSESMQGIGFGSQLMQFMISYCQLKGAKKIVAEIMSDNKPMLALAKRNGFTASPPDDGSVVVELTLGKPKHVT